MARIKIAAAGRRKEADPDVLRAEGQIPAVIYGGTREGALSLTVDRKEFNQLYKQATPSTVFDVDVDGEVVQALMGEVQLDPLTDEPIHADFRQVDMSKPVKATVVLNFIGEAPAVRMLGGILTLNRQELQVEALPEALMPQIDIDLSELKTYADTISISDLNFPEGVTCLNDERAAVALVRPPKKVAVKKEESDDAAEDEAAPAAEGEEKKEDAEESEA